MSRKSRVRMMEGRSWSSPGEDSGRKIRQAWNGQVRVAICPQCGRPLVWELHVCNGNQAVPR